MQPSLALDFRGRRTTVRTDYAGTFDFYRELSGLNTRDHRASLDFTHQATRRIQLFARDQAMLSPTTADALEVSATVLRRQTTRMNAFSGGFESLLGRQTTLNAAYVSQWIEFANEDNERTEPISPIPPSAELLLGGHSHGGTGTLRHRLSQRFSIGADYLIQRAIVANGTETFDVQSALAVSELALSPSTKASFGYGHAWLAAGDGFSDNGPAFDVGLEWTGRHSGATVRYGRTFLPSFGFGGTFQNEELRASIRTALSRSLLWSGSFAISDNDPLEPGDPTLRSISARTALGWVIKRRLRFDALRAARLAGLGAGRRSRAADAGRRPGDGFTDGEGDTVTTNDEAVFDPLAVARRRMWSLALPLVAGAVVGVLLVVLLPREYVAAATIVVTTPSVSADLAKTQSDPSERARAISQELLSLPVIAQVAKEEGLLTGTGDEDVIAGIRARTIVSLPPKTLVSRSDPDTFVVSYAGPTADEAQRVTNRLLKVFIERDGSNRRTRAKDTAAFLGEQLRDSERRMDEVEARLRRLKESNTGLLPDQALANLQAMSDIRQRSDNNAEALRDERDRLAAVEQQLEAARREVAADTRTPGEIAADERVGKLEQELAQAQRSYTAKHPEIQRLEAQLATARIDQAQAKTSASTAGRTPQKADQTVAQLTGDRDRLRARIRELQAIEGRLPQELATYQSRVNQAPIVEQQLQPLEQAYELEKAQHQRLAERYQAAVISENLETRRAGSQFAVLYPASKPATPTRPNVPRVFAFSVIAGAVLGGALALTREYLDKTVHDARTLQHEFDQVVLAEVPHLRRKRA